MNKEPQEKKANYIHKPVLVNEVIDFLNIQQGKIYVDCTIGLGGHSLEILKHLNGRGILIGIDKDKEAVEAAKKKLADFKNCYLFNRDFLELKDILKSLNVDKITGGILLDLGVSSLQLEDPQRGFSFLRNGPLDMRTSQNETLTAEKILNSYNKKDLADIIYKYGEERYSRKIADLVIQKRPIKTTKELAELVLKCYPKRYFKVHPATKTFQALRIEVNKELDNLKSFLCFIPELLEPASRLTVISFHSMEDRIVKRFLKDCSKLQILTKKPVTASFLEIKNNSRARSAKLRAAERKWTL